MKRFIALSAVCVAALGCGDKSESRIARKQKTSEVKPLKPQAATPAPAPLDPYWDNPSWIVLKDDSACPEGMWALFPGSAPGANPAEKKQNEAHRKELADKLRSAVFAIKLKGPAELTLGSYDPGKAKYPVKVKSSIDCRDSAGSITVAWSPSKVVPPEPSVVQANAEVTMRMWQAEPIEWLLHMKSMSEAKLWADRNRLSLEGRVAFKAGKAQVDHKYIRTTKVSHGDLSFGGGSEDWGAGRLLQGQDLQYRLVGEMGKETLLEMRK